MGIKTDIMIGVVVFSILLLVVGMFIGLAFLALKALGVLLVIFGLFMMFAFPGAEDIQGSFGETGIIIGLVILAIGLALLFL
jgi:hypothetical protein